MAALAPGRRAAPAGTAVRWREAARGADGAHLRSCEGMSGLEIEKGIRILGSAKDLDHLKMICVFEIVINSTGAVIPYQEAMQVCS